MSDQFRVGRSGPESSFHPPGRTVYVKACQLTGHFVQSEIEPTKALIILRPQPVPTPIDVRIHLEPGYELSSVKPKVEAVIKSYVDTLGPAKGLAYDPGQENWDDTLRVSKLLAAIVYHRYPGKTCGVKGVSDVDIISPQNNLTPTDHGAVELIVYDTITVTQGAVQ